MGSTGASGNYGSSGGTQSEVNAVADSLLNYMGRQPIPMSELNSLEQESKTADLSRLLEIMSQVGATATVGFDSNMNDSYNIVNGQYSFGSDILAEVEQNPNSMQSIRDSISTAIQSRKQTIANAGKVVNLAKSKIAKNVSDMNAKRPGTTMTNPTIVGASAEGGGLYNVYYELDYKTSDGRTGHSPIQFSTYVRIK